jgi:hypothetical protein
VTKTSAESDADVSLVGLAGWFLFLWGVSQVFPGAWRTPGSFDGWFSFVLSIASWFVGGLATVTHVMIYVTEERKPLFNTPPGLCSVMAGWGFVFVGLVASLHFVSGEASVRAHLSTMTAEHSTGDMEPPLNSRVETLRLQHEKLGTFIAELEREREAIVSRLCQTGREVKGDADPQIYAHELLDIDRSLKQLKDEAHSLSLTIAKAECLWRKTDRQKRMRETGIDSSALNELSALRVQIEERLRSSSLPRSAGEAIQIDKVVREAAGSGR